MSDAPSEVTAVFGSDEALQDGIARLEIAGFDRAKISLPRPGALRPAEATPEHNADTPNTKEDDAQLRTLHASMAGAAAAMAGAGAVIATGGAAAVAVVAAAAAGAAGAGAMHIATRTADDAQHETREARAAQGELRLSVLAENGARAAAAVEALRAAGGEQIEPRTVGTRADAGIAAPRTDSAYRI